MEKREITSNNYLLLKIGNTIGFLLSFFIFSKILYNILGYFNKIPQECDYFCVALAIITIVCFSYLLKKW